LNKEWKNETLRGSLVKTRSNWTIKKNRKWN